MRPDDQRVWLSPGSACEAVWRGKKQEQACGGLFCFIGAEPATSWLTDVALDDHGFVRTDVQLTRGAAHVRVRSMCLRGLRFTCT